MGFKSFFLLKPPTSSCTLHCWVQCIPFQHGCPMVGGRIGSGHQLFSNLKPYFIFQAAANLSFFLKNTVKCKNKTKHATKAHFFCILSHHQIRRPHKERKPKGQRSKHYTGKQAGCCWGSQDLDAFSTHAKRWNVNLLARSLIGNRKRSPGCMDSYFKNLLCLYYDHVI